jgi:hypothetical protein
MRREAELESIVRVKNLETKKRLEKVGQRHEKDALILLAGPGG